MIVKNILLVTVVYIVSCQVMVQAQQSIEERPITEFQLDSVQTDISDSLKAEIYYRLFDKFYYSNLDSGIYVMKQYKEFADNLGDSTYLFLSRHFLGTLYAVKGVNDSSLFYLNAAEDLIHSNIDPVDHGKFYGSFSILYYRDDRYDVALDYLNKAIELYEEGGSISLVASAKSAKGTLLLNVDEYDEALTIYKETLSIRRELNDSTRMVDDIFNIGSTYFYMGFNDSARVYIDEVIAINDARNMRQQSAFAYRLLVTINYQEEDYDSALVYGDIALELSKELGSRYEIQYSHSYLVAVYEALEDYEAAYEYLTTYQQYTDSLQALNTLRF